MAKRTKTGGSLVSLQNAKKRLKQQIAANNKKKKDAQRAAKLRNEITSLKNKLKTTRRKK